MQTQPVVAEVYDEVVFTDPFEAFHERLMRPDAPAAETHPLNEHLTRFDDARGRVAVSRRARASRIMRASPRHASRKRAQAPELETMLKAGEYVRGQLTSVKDSIARLDHQIGLARQLEQSRQAQEAAAQQQAAQRQAKRAQQQAQQGQARPH